MTYAIFITLEAKSQANWRGEEAQRPTDVVDCGRVDAAAPTAIAGSHIQLLRL